MGEKKREEKKTKTKTLLRGKYTLWASCYSVDCKGRVMTICSNGGKKKKKEKKRKNIVSLKDVLIVGGLLFL